MRELTRELIIDSFAGGGGASTGIEMALGRSPDYAINHSASALALHAANHPETVHLDSNIWDVDPRGLVAGRRVGLLWASPDCKHFSKAKGSKPRDRNIRDLAWVVVRWAEEARPDVILIENVEEFRTWGPVYEDGAPIRELAGHTFEDWLRRLKRAGYRVDWRELRACDYGAPTIRKRLFVVARRDGRPIAWPAPTHGAPDSPAVLAGRLLPWRTAGECIDWSIPCPSIFASPEEIRALHGVRAVRPLAAATMARIARGLHRFVLDAQRPFLVVLKGADRRWADIAAPHPTVLAGGGHSALVAPVVTYAQHGGACRPVDAPLHTVCANSKDYNGLLAATLVQTGYGERAGQAPRALDIDHPIGTIVAGGGKHAVAAAYLAQHHTGATGHGAGEPLSTIAATGSHQTPVAAWLAKYYGTGDGSAAGDPAHTITVKDRMAHCEAMCAAPPFGPEHVARARLVADLLRAHGLWDGGDAVTLDVGGVPHVIVDVGMRMLTPCELYRAQGFPEGYRIDGAEVDGAWKDFPRDVQISCVGNSVSPPVAAALVAANCGHLVETMAREAAE